MSFSGHCVIQEESHYGDVAQLGEHHVRNVGVGGSNPLISTKKDPTALKVPWYSAASAAGMIRESVSNEKKSDWLESAPLPGLS